MNFHKKCKHCEERHPACQADCPDYKEFRAAWDAAKEQSTWIHRSKYKPRTSSETIKKNRMRGH